MIALASSSHFERLSSRTLDKYNRGSPINSDNYKWVLSNCVVPWRSLVTIAEATHPRINPPHRMGISSTDGHLREQPFGSTSYCNYHRLLSYVRTSVHFLRSGIAGYTFHVAGIADSSYQAYSSRGLHSAVDKARRSHPTCKKGIF